MCLYAGANIEQCSADCRLTIMGFYGFEGRPYVLGQAGIVDVNIHNLDRWCYMVKCGNWENEIKKRDTSVWLLNLVQAQDWIWPL